MVHAAAKRFDDAVDAYDRALAMETALGNRARQALVMDGLGDAKVERPQLGSFAQWRGVPALANEVLGRISQP